MTSLVLTTSCLTETPFAFASTDPLPTPPPIIQERIVNKTVVTDQDQKSKYSTALGIWIIVFIIFFIATVALVYMWHKGKKVLVSEAQDLTKLEQIIKQKKAEAED